MNYTQGRIRRAVACGALLLAAPAPALPEVDICDCLDSPNSLGDFRASDTGTYPSEWYNANTGTITIPLSADGKLVFDSFIVDRQPGNQSGVLIRFQPNEANDPVRLLVRSDAMIASGSALIVDGSGAPSNQGGAGGPGGFRGGDGAFELETLTPAGGAGLGPAGGLPGTPGDVPTLRSGQSGGFLGSATLNPLIGGSGGGGASSMPGVACVEAGGGGGGGAILIAANGTITLDGAISAHGGSGSIRCQSGVTSGSGSAGAIHLVADTIEGSGSIAASSASPGIVRMQAFTFDFPPGNSSPIAIRSFDPGPVSQPLTPTLAITSISGESVSLANGQPISELPQGGFGGIDVVVSSADPVEVELSSQNIPGGTSVQVAAKPRTGGDPIVTSALLGSCSGQGVCSSSTMLNLAPGTYFIEARALFK